MKGKDKIGATMDSMELERQRGITIQVLCFKVIVRSAVHKHTMDCFLQQLPFVH